MNHNLFNLLNSYAAAFGTEISPEQWEKFEIYMRLLTQWNEKINLTAITEPSEIVVKHFADSLSALPYIRKYREKTDRPLLCDVGTGAGFPGVPLKIVCPGIRLTLLDSLDKRIKFLRALTDETGLSDVELLHARAEDAARIPCRRDSFDIVTARAVAPMNVLLEYCMPFVRTGGIFISMKGSREESGFSGAAKALSAKLISRDKLTLEPCDSRDKNTPSPCDSPDSAAKDTEGSACSATGSDSSAGNDSSLVHDSAEAFARTIYVFEKTGPTAKAFPRKAGTPSKKPL